MPTIKPNPKVRILYATLASLTAAICAITMLSYAQQPVQFPILAAISFRL
jgi:hypothetical protein